jgi:hypothetical protein
VQPIEQMVSKVAVAFDDGEPEIAALIRAETARRSPPDVERPVAPSDRAIRMNTIYQGTCEAATRLGEAAGEHTPQFRKHLRDLRDYIVNNQTSLTNYANAYRNGLRISSAPAESGMNHVFNQRMGKRYGTVTGNIFVDCGGGAKPR